MWYKKYKELNSSLFTMENCGRKLHRPPYRSRRNSAFETINIEGIYGTEKLFKILGYTENPPIMANYPCVAIMFERTDDFEKIWWHYEKE